MKKYIALLTVFFITYNIQAQLQVLALIPKKSEEFRLGYGAFLKFAYPISEMADVSLEAGVNYFPETASDYELGLFPIKVGYRYVPSGTGTGVYLEPQVGYNILGVNTSDEDGSYIEENVKGLVLGAGTGYLFEKSEKGFQFDIGLRFESVLYNGKTINFVGLRLTQNFVFGRRDSY